jgi:hypothetical protein
MTAQRTMKHLAAPGFVTGVATGMTMHGPSSDGNMHVTFFHDTAYPVVGDSAPAPAIPGQNVQTVTSREDEPGKNFEVVRHNIATISMRPEQIEAIGKAFTAVIEQLKTHRAAARRDAESRDGSSQNDPA